MLKDQGQAGSSLTGSEAYNYARRRVETLPQFPPVGAAFVAISVWLFIIFASNILLNQISLLTLGIIVTLSVLVFMTLVILILFLF